MAREGAIIFRDIVGKLDVLNVECDKCGRRSLYHLDRLIERYGLDTKLFDWSDEITADCPRKQAANVNDICGARCPDLPQVLCEAARVFSRYGCIAEWRHTLFCFHSKVTS